ncbi:MAG: hypothetical protein H6621_06380 [Halobacteriovoraceae bacterium]|nr:hypothetical protein [Halobacteriovoraceae bacterium]
MKFLTLAFVLSFLFVSIKAKSEESSFSFDEENKIEEKLPAPKADIFSKFHLMGRVDWTYESTAPFKDDTRVLQRDEYKVNHFLLFLKVKASEKVSFMGEFVSNSFYSFSYQANPHFTVHMGKIMVPFGNPYHFHKYYGGLQGLGAQGVMFPNIWAENGFNLESHLGKVTWDLYTVNGFSSSDPTTTDVDLRNSSNKEHQAVGTRVRLPVVSKLEFVASGYRSRWNENSDELLIGGVDLLGDYGFMPWSFLNSLRMSVGTAYANIENGLLGDFYKRGDYIELATRSYFQSELRLRYGKYIHNSKQETVNDSENYAFGIKFPVDVLQVLLEYQWNTEAVNEVDNDLLRLMISLNF